MKTPVISRPALSLALAVVVLAASACSGVRARSPDAPDASRGTLITAEMVEESGARTIWEALQRTVPATTFTETQNGQPARIRRRGPSTIHLVEDMRIFLDNVLLADIQVLNEISAEVIDHIQVLTTIDATTYYGSEAGDGVIRIYTRIR